MEKVNGKMNVVIINDFDYVQGGASKVAIDTANLLAKNDSLDVYFFSVCHNDNSILDKNIHKICTNQVEALRDKNKIRGAINGIYNFKAKKELKKLLQQLDRDKTIIHIHGWTKCLSSSIFDIIFKMQYKMVLTLHDYFTACPNGGYFNFNKGEICHMKPLSLRCIKCNCDSRNYFFKLYRIVRHFIQNNVVKLNERLTDVIAISEFSENILKDTLGKNVKIHRIYNPIDLDMDLTKVDINKNNYYLYAGRISKEKGVDLFCDAISKLGVEGIVVGDGDEKEKLEKEYPNIKFVGWKNSAEVKEYMKKSKALVFPSRWYEGAPLTPLESMQYGVPCLTSDVCAAKEYVVDDGLTFSLSVNSMIDTIKNYEKRLNYYSDKSYEFIKSRTKINYYEEILKLYKSI